MVKLNEIYKCNICGNIVEVRHASVGELVCCGQPMEHLIEKSKDEGLEKHVPIVEKTSYGILVKVGSVPHPMEEKHYIEFIEVILQDEIHIKYFKPGEKPEHEFKVKGDKFIVREYCNIHGLWGN
jgi:superoxide reductase